MYTFELPEIGEGVLEGEVVKWLVSEGDVVVQDQPVCRVMTDKANVEISVRDGGTVVKLYAEEGDVVKIHSPLMDIDESGAPAAKSAAPAPKAEAPKAPPAAVAPSKPAPAPTLAKQPAAKPAAAPAPAAVTSQPDLRSKNPQPPQCDAERGAGRQPQLRARFWKKRTGHPSRCGGLCRRRASRTESTGCCPAGQGDSFWPRGTNQNHRIET